MGRYCSGVKLFCLFLTVTFASAVFASDRLTTLYSFSGKSDGAEPSSGLVADASGNLYGVTFYGGSCSRSEGCGTVFELSPNGSGGWSENVIHTFAGGSDGELPVGNLIFDANGNLYGTTSGGGPYNQGTAFELSPGASGWTEQIIYSFGSSSSGDIPSGSLTVDADGNLYGMTIFSPNTTVGGTVYEISPGGGGWTQTIVYNFAGGSDGKWPYGSLTLDAAGNLYGTASEGGIINSNCSFGCGTVFRLSSSSTGWTFHRIFAFAGPDGSGPISAPIMDKAGNLYGTTRYGGGKCSSSSGCGVIYNLAETEPGAWKAFLLHVFTDAADGADPFGPLIFDGKGNLYGTTAGSGVADISTVFEVSPVTTGGSTFQTIYSFGIANVVAFPVLFKSEDLFGCTELGGQHGLGSVFQLAPGESSR